MIPLARTHPLLRPAIGTVVTLPSPRNIRFWWNFGSLLGACLGAQILTGLFLAIHYTSGVEVAFDRVRHLSRDTNHGWLVRRLHANGARMFFFCLYFHAGRGIYYHSYRQTPVWGVGVVIILAVMAAAFLGYVLP